MSQRSIMSFFSVQKKKVEDNTERTVAVDADKDKKSPKENGSSDKTPEKKVEVVKKEIKSPESEDGSPIKIQSKKGGSKRIMISSDEEDEDENSSDEIRKSDRQRQRKAPLQAALKEIQAKRAAKKARVSQEPEKVCNTEDDKSEEMDENNQPDDQVKSPEKSVEIGETKTVNSNEKEDTEESSDKKSIENDIKKDEVEEKQSVVEKEQVENKDDLIDNKESLRKEENDSMEIEENVVEKSSDTTIKSENEEFNKSTDEEDDDEEPEEETKKKPIKITKLPAKKATAKKPSSTKPKKVTTSTASNKMSSTIANFFAPKNKDDSGKSGEEKASSTSSDTGYDPSKNKYHPIDDATWERGKPVPYLALARTLECIENISSRLKIQEILSNFYRSVIVLTPENLLQCVYLCLNQLAPAFEGLELGLAEKSLMKAVAQSSGRSEKQVNTELEESGDIGIVAQNSCGRQTKLFKPQPMTVPYVFNQLKVIATMKGKDSMSRKLDKVVAMYNACSPIEARYLIRSLSGKLRIGLAEQTVLQALALACVTTPPKQEYPPEIINASKGISAESFKSKLDKEALILKTTYCECPVYDQIIPMLLEYGIQELPNKCKILPGVPLRPMLAHPTKGVAEVLTRFDGRRFTCEYKYDGERAQIHISGKGATVKIFSRNQEDNTSKYPEVISRLADQLAEHVNECILDCEAVAWDRENNRILPFQVLSTRKKKDANESEIKVQVCLFVFDLLYINGDALVRTPLQERRKLLTEVIKQVPGQLQLAESLDTNSLDEVQAYLEQAVKGNCEGLMVKTLEEEATYEIAKRSRNWLKLKKDYLEGVGDTLDLVVLGGYLGRGKRTGVYGGFLLGCYDPETEEYQSICKIGTGFSDEALQTHSDFFSKHILPGGARPYYRYDSSLEPDHWFDAVQVWEVKCADLSLSPIHKAAIGIVDPEKGISLRFPRFLRIRDDKKVEDATSAQQVADMYESQDQVKNQMDQKTVTEDDFY